MPYRPTLTVVFGDSFAEKLCQTAEILIRQRFQAEICPPIFQFVSCNQTTTDIGKTLLKLQSPDWQRESKEILGDNIKQNVDVIFVSSFHKNDFDLCLKYAKTLRSQLLKIGLESSFNAVFLIAKEILKLDENHLAENAATLERKMSQGEPVFNRCFFLDEINEATITLTDLDQLIELSAIYLDLAIASPMNTEIDKQFPMFFGNGSTKNAYASLSCNVIRISPENINSFLNTELSQRIWYEIHQPLEGSANENKYKINLLEWQNKFLKNQLSENNGASINELEDDKVFQHLKLEIMKLLASELQNQKFNPNNLRAFLDESLEKWLVNLEKYADIIKGEKKKLSEAIIRKLFPIAPKSIQSLPPRPLKFCDRCRSWWRNLFKQKKPQIKPVQTNVGPDYDAIIKKITMDYETGVKKSNILTALFIFLDKIYINLELNKEHFLTVPEEAIISNASIFYTEGLNSDLLRRLFAKEMQLENISDHIRNFSPTLIEEFINELGKYPDGELQKIWNNLCSEIHHFNFNQLDILRKVKGIMPKGVFVFFKPFWNPVAKPDTEEFTIVSWGNSGQNYINELVELISLSGRVLEVDSDNTTNISILQISFGLEIGKFIEQSPTLH
jgi:hypothetical protein